jgi:hypothetical protein
MHSTGSSDSQPPREAAHDGNSTVYLTVNSTRTILSVDALGARPPRCLDHVDAILCGDMPLLQYPRRGPRRHQIRESGKAPIGGYVRTNISHHPGSDLRYARVLGTATVRDQPANMPLASTNRARDECVAPS